jgi:hypothetical protein
VHDHIHTNSSYAPAKQGLIVEDRERRVKLLMDIHRRKEDLYDLTSEAERIYKLPRREAREIARLRQELATQVDCRPNDSTWYVYMIIPLLFNKIS